MTLTPRAHGADLSKYDLFFKPELVTEQLDFVIQRASYGVVKDEAFDLLNPGVQQIGVRGAYHYLNSSMTWQQQLDFFQSVVDGKGFQFFVCDWEGAYNTLDFAFARKAWDFIHNLASRTGKRVFLYTSLSLYNQWIKPSEAQLGVDWDTVPYWQAQWIYNPTIEGNPNGTPTMPVGRTGGWKLWQYTNRGNGSKFGVGRPTTIDLNVWNGSLADMKQYLGIVDLPVVNPVAEVTFTDSNGQVFTGSVELRPR